MVRLYLLKVAIGKFIFGISTVVSALETCRNIFAGPLLQKYGAVLGEGIHFKGRYFFDNVTGDEDSTNDFRKLSIGSGSVIGKGVFFDLTGEIKLGDQVGIGAQSMLMTHMDLGRMPMASIYPRHVASIQIDDGTFLGAHVIIIPGVHLGSCCVVAAGSVITESFPPYSLIAGVPARLVRTLEPPQASKGLHFA
ncbi:MAG: acyltransferase [Saprospiraceae bacterium]